jgi:hypothetical protein
MVKERKKEKSGNGQRAEKGSVHVVYCAGVTRNFAHWQF